MSASSYPAGRPEDEIEAVARALWKRDRGRQPFDPVALAPYRQKAKVAISALDAYRSSPGSSIEGNEG